jgi:glycine/D-amino acid oxidase-like deaminating enzyme
MKHEAASVTRQEKLLNGRSVWERSSGASVPTRKLKHSFKADVAIVGAGISGAFMASALSRRALRVAIFDRRVPVTGSTAASTALLQFEIDTPLIGLREKIGRTNAERAWLRSYRATKDLVKLVRSQDIHCGLEARCALYLAGDRLGARALRKESRARNQLGLPGRYLGPTELRQEFGIERTGAILSPNAAVADPRRLAAGLLRKSVERGARVYSPATVSGVWTSKDGVVLGVGKFFVEASHCIFCTGYELIDAIPKKGTKITSSWAIATAPRTKYPKWLDSTVVWEASQPYLYLRSGPRGRVIIGGEDEDIDFAAYRVRSMGRKSARLARKAERLIPGLKLEPSLKWTGAFGESEDGLPIIDAVPGLPNCYAVLGFGGNGTIYSVMASQIIPSLLSGKQDRDSDLFRFAS